MILQHSHALQVRVFTGSTRHGALTYLSSMRASNQRPQQPLRKFFDKVIRDSSATFSPSDGPKFLKAALELGADDPVDLLYRLTNPQVRSPAAC
jgi:hypothetical protein